MSVPGKLCCLSMLAGSLLLAGCKHHHEWKAYGRDSSHSAHQPDEDKLDPTTAKTLNYTDVYKRQSIGTDRCVRREPKGGHRRYWSWGPARQRLRRCVRRHRR